ncbi:GntR family transcriptional regulator [Salinicoccus cyprini]|uniref:GntR family transcriptional regulator n=1 Tax=Salinicoccus cyprini TaxID=2493691 RepID=A0A558AYC3_9STAP|nr:GntR family transcriptional regulator [Salinicoccus cyprini]TVT29251.1 GntR family transcriptional regulator [Salinicoccus cyprini]
MPKGQKKIPKYKMIENDILQNIKSGRYPKGAPIETEQELSSRYEVSRVTVRQATNNLVARGYLSRSQGSGTYVSEQKVVSRATTVKSFTEEMKAMGKQASSEVLDFRVVPASEEISRKLQLEIGSPVYHIVRLRRADGEPMMIETSYMSVVDYPDLTYERLSRSKYRYIEEEKKLTIAHSHHVVVPIMPTEEMIGHFDCDPASPLLKVFNTTYLADGNILDYTELVINTEKYQYQSIRQK